MKLFELRSGFFLDIDRIEAIESKEDGSIEIYTENRTYKTNADFNTLMQLIEGHRKANSMSKQYFGG